MASSMMQRIVVLSAATLGLATADPDEKPHRMSPGLQHTLSQADHYEKVKMFGEKEPRVSLSGKKWSLDWNSIWQTNKNGEYLGMGLWFDFDIFGTYESPFFQMTRGDSKWMVMNPNLFAEASLSTGILLSFWIWQIKVSATGLFYKFSPLDFQLAWNLEKFNSYCFSVGWFQEVFDIRFDVETTTNECYYGILGMTIGTDNRDCRWLRYKPHLPIYELTFVDKWDKGKDYLPWTCNDDSELQTISRVDEDGDGKEDKHIHGFEPTNTDEGEVWEWTE